MGKLFTDKMLSSDKREIHRRLERGSMPPHIPTDFPGVGAGGYLNLGTSRVPHPHNISALNSKDQNPRKVDRIFDGSDHVGDTGRKLRRRPSIEARARESEYHNLLEGGNLWSADEVTDDLDTDLREPIQSEPMKEDSSNTQRVQLAPPIPDAAVDVPRQSMVSVLYGRQDTDAWYLTRRLARLPASNVAASLDLSTLLRRRNIDANVAELYQLWRRTGIIPTRYRDVNFNPEGIDPQYTWIACWPLINAAIHGYVVEDIEFVDRLMDLLEEKVVKGIRPDSDTISHIFGENRHHMPTALGRFLVDRWVDCAAEGFSDVNLFDLPQHFVYVALESVMKRLSCDERPSSLSDCQYHTHAKPEDCYKRRMVPKAKRQERYRHCREKASREAQQAAADSIECGITTVDCEGRRVEEHRKLRDESDASLPAFDDWIGTSRHMHEANPSDRLGGADTDSKTRLDAKPSSSSMFGTAQAEGPVDEVKFAPLARKPPPTPLPSTCVGRDASIVEGDQSYEPLLRNQQT